MSSESPERTAERINTALISKVTIDYGSGFADKEYPEIVWSTYGLPETNEISVVAEVGNLELGIAHVSGLAWPAMVDRQFGIDVSDQQLAFRLSDELWDAHSERLITEALRIRQPL